MKESFAYFSPYENMKLLNLDTIRPFNVQLVGRSYCDGSYYIYRPDSPIWILEYITKGKGYLEEDGKKFTAEKGDIYILHKNSTHIYRSDADDPWIKTFVCIYGEVADKLFESYNLKMVNLVKAIYAEDLFSELYSSVESAETVSEMEDRCLMCLVKIMQRISRFIPVSAKNKTPARMLKNAIDNIADFSLDGSSFREIIRRTGYTESYIIREFKSEYGITPYRYLTESKIRVASNMLKSSVVSVQEISEKLGFCDSQHFSCVFKKTTGYSPLHYRRLFSGSGNGNISN
ncbi:MAG: helix-turn-helix domain-containing protein [Clostridia bacterium]|nr:helix-turn-helix domain-containing protein [Clostridia bacterium]